MHTYSVPQSALAFKNMLLNIKEPQYPGTSVYQTTSEYLTKKPSDTDKGHKEKRC